MKKALTSVSVVLLLVFFYGCQNSNTENNSSLSAGSQESSQESSQASSQISSPVPELKISDYFPIHENVRYVYQGSGNEYASYDVLIDYTSNNKIQQRVNNGGTVVARVIKNENGKLIKSLSRAEAYYRENLLETADGTEEVLLMEPLKNGTTWTLKDSRTRTITNLAAEVTVPQGSYQAIEVVTEGPNDKTIDYYAPKIGFIKSVFIAGDAEVTSSLSKIEQNIPLVQTIRFYYPNPDDNKIYSVERDVSFKTNDITRQLLESAYKDAVSNSSGKTFSSNVKINSLYLNKDSMVYLDLNSAFITEINAWAEYEEIILQCIANTFGKYYASDKVILTIDNQLYQSDHIAMKKGEYLKTAF